VRKIVVVIGLAQVLGLVMLSGCGGWYNPENPYLQPSENGTPSDRTGGALPNNERKPLYPGWVLTTHLSRSSKDVAHATVGASYPFN
jgi:hypothetical protein